MKKFSLLITDLIVLYSSLALVLLIRYAPAEWQAQEQLHIVPFSLLFAVWVLSFYIANLYERRALRNTRDFFERLAQAITVASILSVLFFYLIPYFGITPKTNLFFFIVLSAGLMTGIRAAVNRFIAGGSKKRLLIVGVNDESLELGKYILDNPQLGWTVRAFVRLEHETVPDQAHQTSWHILEWTTDLLGFIREKNIDTVVISPRAYRHEGLIAMLTAAIAEQVDFASLSSFIERITGTIPLGAINQQWFLENIAEGSKKTYEASKRVLDIISATLLGIPTLLLTPFVALAIALTSRGPIFFMQRRTGRAGTVFTILKFRTMRQDAEHMTGAVWAQKDDPRITGVGRLLRKTRIDELPQLWNILKGDMSLVGPRAERPEFDQRLAHEIPFYMQRYLIKPGLSGWAQINYPYGASTEDAMRKLQYDLYFIKNRSIIFDLEVILKTVSISLRRAGR